MNEGRETFSGGWVVALHMARNGRDGPVRVDPGDTDGEQILVAGVSDKAIIDAKQWEAPAEGRE